MNFQKTPNKDPPFLKLPPPMSTKESSSKKRQRSNTGKTVHKFKPSYVSGLLIRIKELEQINKRLVHMLDNQQFKVQCKNNRNEQLKNTEKAYKKQFLRYRNMYINSEKRGHALFKTYVVEKIDKHGFCHCCHEYAKNLVSIGWNSKSTPFPKTTESSATPTAGDIRTAGHERAIEGWKERECMNEQIKNCSVKSN